MKRIFGFVAMCSIILLFLGTNVEAAQWRLGTDGWWYDNGNGTWPADRWLKIDGKWYYFGSDGYMVKEKWIGYYYLGTDGAMLENTVTPEGIRVDGNGKRITAVSR